MRILGLLLEKGSHMLQCLCGRRLRSSHSPGGERASLSPPPSPPRPGAARPGLAPFPRRPPLRLRLAGAAHRWPGWAGAVRGADPAGRPRDRVAVNSASPTRGSPPPLASPPAGFPTRPPSTRGLAPTLCLIPPGVPSYTEPPCVSFVLTEIPTSHATLIIVPHSTCSPLRSFFFLCNLSISHLTWNPQLWPRLPPGQYGDNLPQSASGPTYLWGWPYCTLVLVEVMSQCFSGGRCLMCF